MDDALKWIGLVILVGGAPFLHLLNHNTGAYGPIEYTHEPCRTMLGGQR